MLLSFVCVKIQWIVCCRWIRAPADACFVQPVKHDKLDYRALAWKRTSNSYNISNFWICSVKVDKCLRTYYKLCWKYLNTAKIISKVTITLSLINSNKDFDFVGWVIKTPCVFYFRSVKFHCVKETHDINSLLTLVKIFLASQHRKTTKQIFVTTRTWKCTRCTMQISYSYLPVSKTFANSPNKQKQ